MIEVGIDIENVNRFKKYTIKDNLDFLKTIFTDSELHYCFSQGIPEKHLAARFCAKEAFTKAASELNISIDFNKIEVLNKENGKPYLNINNKLIDKYEIKISMSHSKDSAVAVVILVRKEY